MNNSQKHPFRHEDALSKYLSPEEIQELTKISCPKTYTFLGIVVFMIMALALWLIFGSIPVVAYGRGIVLQSKTASDIVAKKSGLVAQVFANVGDHVQKGDLLIELINPEHQVKLHQAEKELEKSQDIYQSAQVHLDAKNQQLQKSIQEETQREKELIASLDEEVSFLKKEVKTKKDLYYGGLISFDAVQKSNDQLDEKILEIETHQRQVDKLEKNLGQSAHNQELERYKMNVSQAKRSLEILRAEEEFLRLRSEVDGVVIQSEIEAGKQVSAGTSLMWVSPNEANQGRKIYGFFPAENQDHLLPNMEVRIELEGSSRLKQGFIRGRLASISPLKVTKGDVKRFVRNEYLVNYLTQGKVVKSVVIEIDKDSLNEVSQLASGKNSFPLDAGSLCTFRVLVENKRPLSYFLPEPTYKEVVHQVHETLEDIQEYRQAFQEDENKQELPL